MIYPVIMCGGSGTRLWPVSRPSRPKQFVPIVGDQTLFQDTIERVQGLDGVGRLIVVAGASQIGWIRTQMPEHIRSQIILEPEGRDSAAAIVAAALAIADDDPEGIAIILASDHHVPDADAFRDTLEDAVHAARDGSIVTLGIEPTAPSMAYGYIRPAHANGPVAPVAAFVEKPDAQVAERYIADGYRWNSGNFIARADVLIEEFRSHAPDVLKSVETAYAARVRENGADILGDAFRETRKVSVDYAIMEPTQRAAVVSTSIAWSDLGAWNAVHAALPHDESGNALIGPVLANDTTESLVFNRTDRLCVVDGLDGANVVVDDDAVFVSTLARSQNVKAVVDILTSRSAPETDIVASSSSTFSLCTASDALQAWLKTQALPLWWTHGFDHEVGIWREELRQDASPTESPTRSRVQGRQTFSYALAGRIGWTGPADAIVNAGLRAVDRYCITPDLLTTLIDRSGTVLDDRVLLYDQTFHILALATAADRIDGAEERALRVLDAIEARFEGAVEGFREADDNPFQSNAHMHLLEACMEWVERDASQRWRKTASGIVTLACRDFVDRRSIPEAPFLREFFDGDWQPAKGTAGDVVEPGHQFEWAWLLRRWATITDDKSCAKTAESLYQAGRKGVDPARGIVVETMNPALERVTDRARLWQQSEWLKSALILAEHARPDERVAYLADVRLAHDALRRYLDTPVPGLWRDKANVDGSFVEEPAPASSLYHIATAIVQFTQTASALDPS